MECLYLLYEDLFLIIKANEQRCIDFSSCFDKVSVKTIYFVGHSIYVQVGKVDYTQISELRLQRFAIIGDSKRHDEKCN